MNPGKLLPAAGDHRGGITGAGIARDAAIGSLPATFTLLDERLKVIA